MIRIICPECKNGYLEANGNSLICPECEAHIDSNDENLILGIQYYNECDYDKANDCLMKYIVKNGAEPRAIFYKALCDGFCFDEDTLTLADTYEKILESLKNASKEDFPRYLALANDETEKLERAIAQSHIHLFTDADAEKIKKEVSTIISLQNEAKAFRIKLNALVNEFNDASASKLSTKFSECFLVDPETATQVGDLKFAKISESIASHTVFTGILSTDVKNLEIYYRCIVMFFKKNRQKYEFLMASAEKFAELATLLENGQYNTIKGTASIGEKLKVAGYEFFHESLKDADDDYATQTETVVIIEAEAEETEKVEVEMEDVSSVSEPEAAQETVTSEETALCTDVPDKTPDEDSSNDIPADATQVISAKEVTSEVVLEESEISQDVTEPTEVIDVVTDTVETVEASDESVESTQESIETIEEISDEAESGTVEPDEEAVQTEDVQLTFETISDESDADDETAVESPKTKQKHKTHYAPFVALLAVVFGIIAIICATVIPKKLNEKNYVQASELLQQGKYEEAAAVYAELEDYENSEELYKSARYNYAAKLEKEENFAEAKKIYEALAEYEDSMAKATSCAYNIALKTLDEGKFDEAKALFEEIPEYADSKEKAKECVFQKGCSLIAEKKFEEAIETLETLEKYKPATEKILEAKYKFCEANPSKDNKTTIKFIDELIEARYKDSVLLRKKILGETVVETVEGVGAISVINYSASNIKENLKEADKSKPIYFHATVTDRTYYGKTLTAKFTTSVGYTERKTLTLSESDNTYHLLYPSTTVSNYTVEFSLIAPDGTVLVSQVITIK